MILVALLVMSCNRDEIQAQTTNYETMTTKMYITIDGRTEAVTLTNNSATQALVAKLQEASVTVTLNSSGGFEIWGALGFSLPTSNEQINARPGDIVLYNGSNICMFYGTSSWNYTLLGKIDGLSESELRTFLKAGESNISVTLSLAETTGIKGLSPNPSPVREGRIYSLNGVKIENPSKGIYIKNGKKVIL
ncbi:cyclophilin-like fold protein [Xylanibacter brevis]|uniref:cyclophilin-like fold protein n=1 Tax=Xylanibacter brevis TaxID=83231 RepID=UPI0012DCC9D4|nr:cyclophilin-like fold protein [Xylanibacter brevis]